MTRSITLLLVSLSVLLALVTAASIPECTDGKVYNSCGTECPPTCDELKPTCISSCSPGCFCPDGTVLNSWGKCVDKNKCSLCSGNTTYSDCANNCPCVVSPPECVRTACQQGCACKPDYALIPNSIPKRCVRRNDLPEECPKE